MPKSLEELKSEVKNYFELNNENFSIVCEAENQKYPIKSDIDL